MAIQCAIKTMRTIEELPILGSMPALHRDRLGFLLALSRACGDVARFHFGPFPVLFFNTAELVHGVLVEHAGDFDAGTPRKRAYGWVLGNGLLSSEGELHRRQRKAMAPAFQPRHLAKFAEAIVGYGERAQAAWRDAAVVDLNREMTHLTMSTIGKVLLDADVFTEADALGAATAVVLEHIDYSLSRLVPLPLDWPLPRHRQTREALAFLQARIRAMIDERRRDGVERDDLLSVLLRTHDDDGHPMSDEQVRDEVHTLFGAGYETTATALSWAWYLLATHSESYERVLQEVDRVLQGRSPTYADLAQLPYALQALKETLRLYPPSYALTRVARKDVTIAGYQVQRHDAVLLPPYTLHRRPDYYPDPSRFDPERFTPEREARLPRGAYIPFGAGPRICIGNHFALMEGHLLLATLAQRVRFELVPGQRIEPDPKVTIRPRGGMQMVVRRRPGFAACAPPLGANDQGTRV
jgi:cytochrome P450